MNERTTLEIIAPTVEEAIAQGLAQLGLTADAVSIEVLDTGNRGLFGLGKPQVRVRLTVNPPAGEVQETRTESAVPAALSESTLAPGAHLPRAQVPGSAGEVRRKRNRWSRLARTTSRLLSKPRLQPGLLNPN